MANNILEDHAIFLSYPLHVGNCMQEAYLIYYMMTHSCGWEKVNFDQPLK